MHWTPDLYKRALDFAARAHGAQTVPGSGFPYVVHVTKVAMEVMHACLAAPSLDADLAMVCALLHDSLEDAGVALDALAQAFGPQVAAGVDALTKRETVPKAERIADSLRRIQAQPKEVWLVKLADRITNLEPPPPAWTLEKRRAYRAEARTIHTALGSAHAGLAARLEAKMLEYQAFCEDT